MVRSLHHIRFINSTQAVNTKVLNLESKQAIRLLSIGWIPNPKKKILILIKTIQRKRNSKKMIPKKMLI